MKVIHAPNCAIYRLVPTECDCLPGVVIQCPACSKSFLYKESDNKIPRHFIKKTFFHEFECSGSQKDVIT